MENHSDLKLGKSRGVAILGPHSHMVIISINCPVCWFSCCSPVILPLWPPKSVESATPGLVRSGAQCLSGNTESVWVFEMWKLIIYSRESRVIVIIPLWSASQVPRHCAVCYIYYLIEMLQPCEVGLKQFLAGGGEGKITHRIQDKKAL